MATPHSTLEWRLDALNFFLADVRGGLGPYINVFLVTAAGWTPFEVGTVLTISGLIGITLHAPVGALIDAVRAKRAILVVAVALLAACGVATERMPTIPVVFSTDVIMAMLGGVFAPTVAALTLGLFAKRALAERFARNAVFDRAGNIAIAIIVGVVGWWLGQRVTFYLVALFAAVSVAFVLTIPAASIDHDRARGFVKGQVEGHAQDFLALLAGNRPLLVLIGVVAMFSFAKGSMLSLVGQKLALAHPGYESALTSACILLAQLTTIPVAMVVGQKTKVWGLKILLGVACLAVVARALVFATFDSAVVLVGAEVLDGISDGIFDVLLPLILADFVVGSGRYSTSRGILGTVQGAGGSLSNAAGGWLVVWGGYGSAFLGFAAFAALALCLVLLLPETERAPVEFTPGSLE